MSLFQLLARDSPSASLLSGTWKSRSQDAAQQAQQGEQQGEEIVAVDLVWVFKEMDGMADSPFMQQMERWVGG